MTWVTTIVTQKRKMRADRLIRLILHLQSHGTTTTAKLSEELGVSRRTILRDLDALSISGVPVYGQGGHGGGVSLDEGYRTSLTGMTEREMTALVLGSQVDLLKEIGWGDAGKVSFEKLNASIPTRFKPTIDLMRQRFLIDPHWWWHQAGSPNVMEELQKAVSGDLKLEIDYEDWDGVKSRKKVDPYSLVSKSGAWYLVAFNGREFRTYRISRISCVEAAPVRFTRDPNFDLPSYWKSQESAFQNQFSQFEATLEVHTSRLKFVTAIVPGRSEVLEDLNGKESESEDWKKVRVALDSEELAAMLVFGLGKWGRVLAPEALKERVFKQAKEIMES